MPTEIATSPSSSSVPKIKFGPISRRPHPRDVPSSLPPGMKPHPTVLTSPHLSGLSSSHVYSNWRLLASSSLSSSPFPIGGTTSLKTHEQTGRSLEVDPSNLYSGTSNVTPGPGSYDVLKSYGGVGADLAKRSGKGEAFAGTQGSAPRDCFLPRAGHCLPWRTTVSPRPGPGTYGGGDEGIYGRRSATFDARDRDVRKLEDNVTAMRVVEADIRRLKEKMQGLDKLTPDEARLVKLDMARSSKNLKAKLKIVSDEVLAQKEKMDAIAKHPGRHGKAKSLIFANNVALSVPLSNSASRFFDPIDSKASFLESPGPGTHDVSTYGSTFGNATLGVLSRGVSKPSPWGAYKGLRPMDVAAPSERSVATLRLNEHGYAYFADLNEACGVTYQPNSMPRGKAEAEGEEREGRKRTNLGKGGKRVGVVTVSKL